MNTDPVNMFRAQRTDGSFFYFHARGLLDAYRFCRDTGERVCGIKPV